MPTLMSPLQPSWAPICRAIAIVGACVAVGSLTVTTHSRTSDGVYSCGNILTRDVETLRRDYCAAVGVYRHRLLVLLAATLLAVLAAATAIVVRNQSVRPST